MKRTLLMDLMLLTGVSMVFTALAIAQPPKVAVDVAVVATEAAKEDQPILPDDFANTGEANRVNATWSQSGMIPGVTLRTTDGSFPCAPCEQQKQILIEAGGMTKDGVPIWPFRIEPTAEFRVPSWVPDGGDESKILYGVREPKTLKLWIEGYAKKVSGNSPENVTVSVDGSDSRAIFLALAECIRRQDDTQPAAQGFLPAIPIDVNDDLLKVLDALLTKEGYTGKGFQVSWPVGKRSMTFEPGISVTVRKIVEVDAQVTAVVIDGRDVTLSLSGTIVKNLTVRLK